MADLNALKDSLSELTLKEAAELVKTLEEEWGVSAAAPVAVAAAPGAGDGGGEAADAAPGPVKEKVSKEEAEKIKAQLEEAGAVVEIK